jgi:uncharacterized membrane protein
MNEKENEWYFRTNFNTYITILILIIMTVSFFWSLLIPTTHRP